MTWLTLVTFIQWQSRAMTALFCKLTNPLVLISRDVETFVAVTLDFGDQVFDLVVFYWKAMLLELSQGTVNSTSLTSLELRWMRTRSGFSTDIARSGN